MHVSACPCRARGTCRRLAGCAPAVVRHEDLRGVDVVVDHARALQRPAGVEQRRGGEGGEGEELERVLLLEGEQLPLLAIIDVLNELLQRAARALHHQVDVGVVLQRAVQRQHEGAEPVVGQLRVRRNLVLHMEGVRHNAVEGALAPLATRHKNLANDLDGEREARVVRIVREGHHHTMPTAAQDKAISHRLHRVAVEAIVLAGRVQPARFAESGGDRTLRPYP